MLPGTDAVREASSLSLGTANAGASAPRGQLQESQDQQQSQLQQLPPPGLYSFLVDRRHDACAIPIHSYADDKSQDWRMRDRLKTVSVALVLCLNIGIDPPDVLKTSPCAKLECWVDPMSLPPQRALEAIGKNLQQQYEGGVWQPRSRYKLMRDPSVEETKKTCISLRKNAKDERILFHYNGHGVPKPTRGGEIWVFNKSYTQYLPCSLYDIQSWLGSPCIYVFDCSNAGNILQAFDRFADQRDEEAARKVDIDPGYVSMRECILLGACGPNDTLPMNPDLPADLFTCCLTTPIEIALRWFVAQDPLLHDITADMIMKIPGQLSDRRTPLGELNWIFTAITDTIAWNVLPHDLFKKLFRQDLMVAALFRNFLLAERIMRFYHCTPMSFPVLPPTHQHPLWASWDLAAEMCLYQLPELLKTPSTTQYQHSAFFSEQLTAFEVWLSKGPIAKSRPEQLPILLQVLLSQVHRLRALMLLSRFLDLGPWSVKLALSVGIFPYVLKLLQSPAPELKPVLVFIWAKILALDSSCQNDLLKDNGFTYFINIMTSVNSPVVIPNMSEHRAMCAFILSVFCHRFVFAQEACLKNDMLLTLSLHLTDSDSLLRQWTCICLAKLVEDYAFGRECCLREGMQDRIVVLLADVSAEVRAAAVFAIGCLVQQESKSGSGENELSKESLLNNTAAVNKAVCSVIVHGLADASPIVRKEVVIVLSRVVHFGLEMTIAAAADFIAAEKPIQVVGEGSRPSDSSADNVYSIAYKGLLALSVDAFPLVAALAKHVVDRVHAHLLMSQVIVSPSPRLASGAASTAAPMAVSGSAKRQSAASIMSGNSSFGGVSPATNALNGIQNARRSASTYSEAGPGSSGAPGASSNAYGSSPTSSIVSAASVHNGSAAMKRNSSFANPFKSLQGLASLVAFPSGGLVPERSLGSAAGNDSVGASSAGAGDQMRGTPSGIGSLADEGIISFQLSKNDLAKGVSVHTSSTDDKTCLLRSCFYEWSLEYFREPQMKVPEADDPGSLQFNQRLWRHQQNEKSATSSFLKSTDASLLKFDHQVNFLHSDNNPGTHLYFHPFEPHLLGADNADGVIVYNWEEGVKINWFSNSNPIGTRITALRFINENDIALVVTGTDEGIVRIYKNYTSVENCEIVSAWRAVNEHVPSGSRGSADLIMDWHQHSGSLMVAGDLRMIHIWDVERELCVQNIGTKYHQAVTSLTAEKKDGNLMVVGYDDGVMNMYDKRVPSREGLVQTFREHKSRLLRCQFQNDLRGDCYTLVSGGVTGDVRVWDIRTPERSLRAVNTVPAGVSMTALAIHDDAPLFACGTNAEYVRIFNINGTNLNTIRHNEGFLAPRIGYVGCLAFHPYRDVLAAGTKQNASLSLFSSQR
ncbi:hypothetical protein HDU84_001508 [Entophlyctis sp. JEL0112]|nr:hypothetical protein HDU84_001508 [Entophlyctis sp. JEL0112]